jgi:preprotein translocase subunit SecA
MMDVLKVPEDMPIENGMISRSIESAQKKVEAHHFDIRKHLVEYDDVMNKQREIIYGQRRKILKHENIKDEIQKILEDEARAIANSLSAERKKEDWDLAEIAKQLGGIFDNAPTEEQLGEFLKQPELADFTAAEMQKAYQAREESLPNREALRFAERQIYLSTIDRLWMEHLENMRHLREKVSLRGFGQRDPLIEYKNEAYISFEELLGNIRGNTIRALFKLKVEAAAPPPPSLRTEIPTKIMTNEGSVEDILTGDRELSPEQTQEVASAAAKFLKADPKIQNLGNSGVVKIRADDSQNPTPQKSDNPTVVRVADEPAGNSNTEKVGRNDPCPCGSGKKFKKCCGQNS